MISLASITAKTSHITDTSIKGGDAMFCKSTRTVTDIWDENAGCPG
jgi:hypothetical protein